MLSICVLLAVLVLGPLVYTFASTRGNRYDLENTKASNIPYHRVAIVFGAGILPNGQPTPYLKNRVQTAVDLYKAGRVKLLLMTGDNSTKNHNEPTVMKNYAVSLGVPAKAVKLDYAGFNTYDSCYRAHYIFGLDDATLVTQGYHLPRALVTCKGLGIKSTGVIALHPSRDFTINYLIREVLSTDKMAFQLTFKPHPTALGKPEPF
jgi:vancomycin permeability regulator SanA